jgi:leucine dehydrogenase
MNKLESLVPGERPEPPTGPRRGEAVFEHREFNQHERVCFVVDERAGLQAIIAVHSTLRGPAVGGCRMWHYPTSADALADVLRLSRGMSLKAAVADLPLGGGKAVIMRPKGSYDRRRVMEAFGKAVDEFGGTYWTAEDVGTSVDDMEVIASRTRYVAGRASGRRASGDPSPFTAFGVATCLQAAVDHLWAAKSLSGLEIAVQGLGNVGMELCRILHDSGARLIVADIDERKTRAAIEAFGARAVGVDQIHASKCDVLAPCALGGVLNARTIPHIRARLVCGAANNQLETIDDATRLQQRGITYAPDFIANAAGICSVASEILDINDPAWVRTRITALGQTLRDVLARSAESHETTAVIAERIARSRIEDAR